MTTITGKAGIGGGLAPAQLGPNKSYVLVRSVEPVTSTAGTTIQPVASRHDINPDGTFSISLEALPPGFAYEFRFSYNGGEYLSPPRTCEVPASGTVQYKDLVDIVPPDHGGWGVPGWLLELLAGGGTGSGSGEDGESPQLQVSGGYIQWKLPSSASWTNLVALSTLKGADGTDGLDGDDGTDGREVSLQLTATHIQWRLGTDAWTNLVALADLKGADGDDGEAVALQLTATHIQWRVGTGTWTDLVAIADLKGAKGDNGEAVSLQKTSTHIQWRLGTGTWTDLVAIADLKGAKGDNGEAVSLQKTSTHIQWRLGTGTWSNLVALADLKGDQGEAGNPFAYGVRPVIYFNRTTNTWPTRLSGIPLGYTGPVDFDCTDGTFPGHPTDAQSGDRIARRA